MEPHPMEHVPLKAKIYMENYQNSGSLEWKDCAANRFKIMTMVDDKLTCWTMKFEQLEAGWGNRLLKVEETDDIITLDTSDWSPEFKKQLAEAHGEQRQEDITASTSS
jgi:hypothetical protein